MVEEKSEKNVEEVNVKKVEEDVKTEKRAEETGKVIKPGETPTVVGKAEERREFMGWKPKTKMGRDVLEGKIKSIDEILNSGKRIMESEIVDMLVPDLKSELILIGGRSGKGGGIKRIPVKITATMHRSGRRFKMNAFVAVGDPYILYVSEYKTSITKFPLIQSSLVKLKPPSDFRLHLGM